MRRFIGVLCLLLGACTSISQTTEQRRENITTWRVVAVASAGVDVVTTFIGQRSGVREQNPLLGQRSERIIAVNAAILGAVWWFSRDLPPDQQARMWKVIAALHLGAAIWNGSELRK